MLREQFHVRGRPDARGFEDGAVFDLGGRTVTVVHLPGHTAGHCGFLVEPDGFLFVADVDLTSFGPYYGDVGSSLAEFEASIGRLREIEARWYGTAHQKGVIEGAEEFRSRLDAYAGVIQRREETLLKFLDGPRTVEEIVEHRLVYRPHVRGHTYGRWSGARPSGTWTDCWSGAASPRWSRAATEPYSRTATAPCSRVRGPPRPSRSENRPTAQTVPSTGRSGTPGTATGWSARSSPRPRQHRPEPYAGLLRRRAAGHICVSTRSAASTSTTDRGSCGCQPTRSSSSPTS